MGEVIFNKDNIAKLKRVNIRYLKQRAAKSLDGKVRLCLHKNLQDSLHEMIIVLRRDVYVRPHRHMFKTETFHLIEGKMRIFIFDDKGSVSNQIFMDSENKTTNFLCRLEKKIWHMVVPLTDFVVFHEITNGPYTGKGDSIFAPWSPLESNRTGIKEFIQRLLASG